MVRSPIYSRRGAARQMVLLAVMVVLALAVAWMWWGGGTTQASVEESVAVAEKFLAQVRAGQASQAWDSTTAEFKSYEGRETFLKFVKAHPPLAQPLSFVSVQTVTVQGSPRAECIFRAPDGKTTVHLLVGNDRGAWRVDRIRAD